MENRWLLATFVVNSTAATGDAHQDDGICDTGIIDHPDPARRFPTGICTLNAAIFNANIHPGPDEIHFGIPGGGVKTIDVVSETAWDSVTIDGTTQPGYNGTPLIEVHGRIAMRAEFWSQSPLDFAIRGMAVLGLTVSGRPTHDVNVTIEGNHIGVDATGEESISIGGEHGHNSGISIMAGGQCDIIIGGDSEEARNIISGNAGSGIHAEACRGTVVGNYIGTTRDGDVELGNDVWGVFTEGGAWTIKDNVISANGIGGIYTLGNGIIQGNKIGTDAEGTKPMGNRRFGILAWGDNTIGGVMPGDGNLIAANGKPAEQDGGPNPQIGPEDTTVGGIVVPWGGSVIQGNRIGTGMTGTETELGNAILGNSIYANDGLGIDLWKRVVVGGFGEWRYGEGVSPNDQLDEDDGGNNQQNYPVITSLRTTDVGTTIDGMLHSTPNAPFRIELFVSDTADPSDFGEGQTLLGAIGSLDGSDAVMTDEDGNASFTFHTGETVPLAHAVSATATNLDTMDTSEFSGSVELKPVIVNSIGDASDFDAWDGVCDTGGTITRGSEQEPECTLRAAIEEVNGGLLGPEITFDIPNGVVPTITPTTALPTITSVVTIDASSQPGDDMVTLDGISVPPDADGLTITVGGTTVKGLTIHRFNNGIVLRGGVGSTIEDCVLGNAKVDYGNRGNGVLIDGSPDNTLLNNIISGNDDYGIHIQGTSATGNKLLGNRIGTDEAGTKRLGNDLGGVLIKSSNNTIGGVNHTLGQCDGDCNLISGNGAEGTSGVGEGIRIEGIAATNNAILGNFIGTQLDGKAQLANDLHGVFIQEAPDNVVGGTREISFRETVSPGFESKGAALPAIGSKATTSGRISRVTDE